MTGERIGRIWWVLCAAFGVVATGLFATIRIWGDGTLATYSAAIVGFWWLLPAVPLLVLALIRRRWLVTVALLVPAVAWTWVFGPLLIPGAPGVPTDAARPELRVVTFNVSPHGTADQIAELAERTDPDVLLVQELRPEARRGLEGRLGALPHRWYADVNRSAPGGGGVGVLSRHPVIDGRLVRGLPDASRPTGTVTLDVEGTQLSVMSVHLSSPCFDCLADDVVGGRLFRVDEPTTLRRRETELIVDALPDGPLVVAGDLNSSVLNEPLRTFLDAGLTDSFQAVGWGPGFTRGSERDVSRIDFVLLGGGVTPQRSYVVGETSSDHRAVVTDVVLP